MNVVYPWREAPIADFAVIGDPVSHSRSPLMHEAAYKALGLNFTYVAIHVPRGEAWDALARLAHLQYWGANVTVPHKEEALEWAEVAEPLAERVQAANTIRFMDRACINTDAPGFLDTLADYQPERRTALLLGAGGSARALAVALMDAGYELKIYNRTEAKASALAEEIGLSTENVLVIADPGGSSLIVNTTSASLTNDDLPILWDRVEQGALAYDLMYSKELTPFLRSAKDRGLETMDGLPMLVAQGARSFEWWLELPAPRDIMLAAIQ